MVVDAAERRRLLEQYDRSGQSQQEFAREHGINYNTLVNWLYVRRKRKGRKEESGQRMRFEELSLEGPAKGAGAELTIRLPNGVVFEIRNEAGLGLALAKEIVGLHGGRLQIESPVPGSNRGTRVSVVLPMVESAYILTVSSDAAHRQELAEKFELQGYRVRLATTAADLQEELSRSRPDVVLLDLAGQEQELRNAVLRMKSRRGGMRLPLVALMPQEASEDTTMVLRSFSVNMLDGDSTSEEVLDTVTGSFLTKAGFGGPAALRIDRAARSGGRSRIQETLENG